MTYARGEALSESQRAGLASEKAHDSELGTSHLVRGLRAEVEKALEQLRRTSDGELDESRSVGRAGLPSTVRGLLYHVGEHAARHAGQVVTTVKILEGQSSTSPD
jgi:uncharacterized damage-inducible protein DinB